MEIDDFSGLLSGISDPETELVEGNLRDSGRTINSQNARNPIKNTQYNIKHAGIQGYENTRMQNEKQRTLGYRIEEILRSLVAPLKRGRRIHMLPL